MRRATRPLCVGRTMRTAISASRRARSSVRLVSASSMAMPGCSAWNAARIGGSTSQPMTWLAVTRTTPRSALASPEAVRANAAAAAAIASACGASASAAEVGVRPRGERVNKADPSAASRASMWRPTVGWERPSRRAAPERLRSRATSMKVRSSSQLGGRRPAIRNRIADQHKYAIPFTSGGA
jgi:hypothetical protein